MSDDPPQQPAGSRMQIAGFTLYTIFFLVLSPLVLTAQEATESIIQRQARDYARHDISAEKGWDSLNGQSTTDVSFGKPAPCALDRIVFGWHPYWMGTSYNNYDYTLLSDISYFSYEVDTATGGYTTVRNWKTTDLIPKAKAAGTRVNLCVTLFGGHGAVLGNAKRRQTLIDSLVQLIKLRDADGVNIDFEGVPAGQRSNLSTFMIDLAKQFHARVNGSQISMAIPAVDWSNVFDVAAMAPHVDLFIIMGYDYHWTNSQNAGPVSPRNSGSFWSPYDITRSVNAYLNKGVPAAKLCLGLPYYGYRWATEDSAMGATTVGSASSVRYSMAATEAAAYGRRWDRQSSTPYYVYRADDVWRQTWYDDRESLGMKYDMALMKELAGVGVWALGYDGERSELWELLREKFTTCRSSACSGLFTDMGGPAGNYSDNEHYRFTIRPDAGKGVALTFTEFDVGDDRLRIYDGTSAAAPLMAEFTGTQQPGTMTTTGEAMTLEFISDDSLTAAGWNATWQCTERPLSTDDRRTAALPLNPALTVAPNPAHGTVVISYTVPFEGTARIRIVDPLGREITTIANEVRSRGEYRQTVDLNRPALPSGLYMIRLDVGTGTTHALLSISR